MAAWPVTLPDDVLLDGFSESPPENVIRSSMDVGPPKDRRRSASAPRPIAARQYMTTAQVATLDTFFVTTLLGGADAFDWTSARTGASVEFRFVKPPEYTPQGVGWMVAMSLEILP